MGFRNRSWTLSLQVRRRGGVLTLFFVLECGVEWGVGSVCVLFCLDVHLPPIPLLSPVFIVCVVHSTLCLCVLLPRWPLFPAFPVVPELIPELRDGGRGAHAQICITDDKGTLARKSGPPRSYNFCQEIIMETTSFIAAGLVKYINGVLNGTDDSQSDVSDHVHALIYELLLVTKMKTGLSDPLLLTVIPTLASQLESDDEQTRLRSTACLGQLFSIDRSLIRKNKVHLNNLLKRNIDASPAVRQQYVKMLGRLLLVLKDSHEEEHEHIMQVLNSLFKDRDKLVRLACVVSEQCGTRLVSQTWFTAVIRSNLWLFFDFHSTFTRLLLDCYSTVTRLLLDSFTCFTVVCPPLSCCARAPLAQQTVAQVANTGLNYVSKALMAGLSDRTVDKDPEVRESATIAISKIFNSKISAVWNQNGEEWDPTMGTRSFFAHLDAHER